MDIRCSEQLAVMADRELLVQALGNVISNAIEHAGTLVHVEARRDGGDVVVDIHDDGPGIPLEERQSVFERFYRSPGLTGKGSGLGLPIALAAARATAADLELVAEGDGTTFRFTIPGARRL
jgi:signal transduction histidine kinase